MCLHGCCSWYKLNQEQDKTSQQLGDWEHAKQHADSQAAGRWEGSWEVWVDDSVAKGIADKDGCKGKL